LRAARIAVLVLLAGCGSDDRQAPAPADFVIVKAPVNSGDTQVGIAGRELDQELRVLVTRDDHPAEGVTVYWSTPEGSVSPATRVTDADGISSTRWTLQNLFAQQVALAGLEPDSPTPVVFTAISAPDPDAPNTVLVLNDGGNRFEPAAITVSVGDTVNWVWPVGSVGHNILPDDGDLPPNSGAPADHPKFLSFRFTIPGVYHYHCTVHGGPGGVGMAGTVTVLPSPPSG
jgi:plastocyanin